MDWRSIKNDPPAPGTGIRATDGKSVFVGHITQSGLCFTGTDLSDGTEIVITPDAMTEWMPLENQPENFTQKVKRIISEIRDMIGEKMYYGEMVGAPGPYCHCGPMVYENPEDYNLEKAADILQGALDGNFLGDPDLMPEKTADEMFRDLGYKKVKPINHNQIIRYERWETPTTHWEIIVDSDRHYWFRENGKSKGMTEHEVRACARLNEELEAENG